jgi:hypothetical protein
VPAFTEEAAAADTAGDAGPRRGVEVLQVVAADGVKVGEGRRSVASEGRLRRMGHGAGLDDSDGEFGDDALDFRVQSRLLSRSHDCRVGLQCVVSA